MSNWEVIIQWFGIISGAASIISLIISLIVKSQVLKIKGNIEIIKTRVEQIQQTTTGNNSPIIANKGDAYYKN